MKHPSLLEPGRTRAALYALLLSLPLSSLACSAGTIEGTTGGTSTTDGADGAALPGDGEDGPGDTPDGSPDAADGSDSSDGSDEPGAPDEPGVPNAGPSDTLRVEGRYLLDTCGNRFVVRGVEQFFGLGIDVNGSFTTLVDEIAQTGANAVRALPNVSQLSVADVDAILARIVEHDMVIFLSPGDRTWFAREDVQTMLAKYDPWLIVDAFQEPNYDDRARWQGDVEGAIQLVRDEGYAVPITVLANLYGRDLPSLLMYGSDVAAMDPLHNVVLGWQAYWGVNGFYQGHFAMELQEAFATIAAQPFPIQAGIDGFADPGEAMDYVSAMGAAQGEDVGWLWWDWYNPFGRSNNLTSDGTAAHLTELGNVVVTDDPNGLASAHKACRPAGR